MGWATEVASEGHFGAAMRFFEELSLAGLGQIPGLSPQHAEQLASYVPLTFLLSLYLLVVYLVLSLVYGESGAVPDLSVEATEFEGCDSIDAPKYDPNTPTQPGSIPCYDPGTMQYLGEVSLSQHASLSCNHFCLLMAVDTSRETNHIEFGSILIYLLKLFLEGRRSLLLSSMRGHSFVGKIRW
jgi:hypothetical protein